MSTTTRARYISALFLITFIIQPSFATNPKPQKYSLDKCIEMGLLKNISIIRGENAVVSAASRKRQAFGEFIPSVNASATWTRADREQLRFRNEQFFRARDNLSASLSANLTLFDGLSNIAAADQGIINQRSAELDFTRTKQDVVYQIQQAFYNVLRYKQLLSAARENLKRSRKQLERIQEFNRVGSVPLADVYRQQVQSGRDELSLIQAENNVNNAIADLTFLVGLQPTEEFDVDESAVQTTIDSFVIQDFRAQVKDYQSTVRKAITSRPDYQSAVELKNSAGKGVIISRAGYFPTLSAFASYSWTDFEFKEFLRDIQQKDYFSYGLQLSIPILSNFRTSSSVEQAMVVERNAEENVNQLERQIAVQVKKALNELETAEKNIEIAKRNLIAAQEDLRIAEERYSIGAGTLLDQVTANASFIAAQSDDVNSIYNYLTARKQVEYLLGTGAY